MFASFRIFVIAATIALPMPLPSSAWYVTMFLEYEWQQYQRPALTVEEP